MPAVLRAFAVFFGKKAGEKAGIHDAAPGIPQGTTFVSPPKRSTASWGTPPRNERRRIAHTADIVLGVRQEPGRTLYDKAEIELRDSWAIRGCTVR